MPKPTTKKAKTTKTKPVKKPQPRKKVDKKKNSLDYTPEEWLKVRFKEEKEEFKKYAPDLEPGSGKSTKRCAVTAMTLAHHSSQESLKALKKFKQDKRAPGWIDCAIEECQMNLWMDTTGRQLDQARDKLVQAAQNVFDQHYPDKEIITNALKVELKKQKTKFTYGKSVKLSYKGKVVGEDKTEFIIDDILLVSIKPTFTNWLMRFKQGSEGKTLQSADLENIEQVENYDDQGNPLDQPKSLSEAFDKFYGDYFYNLLKMSGLEEGILLDFSGEKLYGEYFNPPHESGWISDGCSGWCQGCLRELKCETAREFKVEEDRKRYRILKKLIQQIVETENKIRTTHKPSEDLEYQIKTAEKLKDKIEDQIEKEKNKNIIRSLEQDLKRWQIQICALQSLLSFEQPKTEDLEHLKTIQELYNAIKEEVETDEYKNDVEGLEVYYGKAKPKPGSEACYHDPLCDCDDPEEGGIVGDYDYSQEGINMDEVPF